jgi:hypothetical protein
VPGRRDVRAITLAVIITGSVLAAGCGAQKKPLTEDAYRADATSICKAANKAADTVEEDTRIPDIRTVLSTLLVVVQDRLEALQRLVPPPSFRARHQRVIELDKRAVSLIAEGVAKMKNGNDAAAAVVPVRKLDAIVNAEIRIWKDLGIEECALE